MGMIGAAGAWLIAALVLGIAELAAPGIFLVFLALAAGMTGIALLALPELPIAVQLASFAVWSTVTVLIGRRCYRDYPVAGADPMLNDRSARMVGQIVIVETAIVDGRGRVLVGDGSWPARGDDAAAGTHVRITRVADGVADVTPV